MPIGSIAAVILLGFALRATIISATHTQSDDESSCCLCDSCHAVPLAKEQVILLHNHHHLGNTCWDLDLSLKEQRELLDLQECTFVKRDYEIVCCTQGFEGIDIFNVHAKLSSRKQQEVDSSNGSTLFASYFRAARELWQASSTSWKPQTSALSLQVPSDSSDRQPSITHSVTNSSAGERSSSPWGSSAFGSSFFFSDSSESSRPSVRVRTETRIVPSTNSSSNNNRNNNNRNRSNHNRTDSKRSDSDNDNDSSSNNNNRSDDMNDNNNRSDTNRTDSKPDNNRTRSSPWQGNTDRTNNNTIDRNGNRTDASRGNGSPSSTGPDDSSTHSRNNNNNRTGSGNNNNTSHGSSNTTMGNFAEQGSTAYWSDHSGDVVTVTCTYEPVGVRFQTPGGNYGFGICRDGSRPTAVAQGAAIWDPNENKMFRGDCQMIDQLTRDGYLSNNMCRITQLHLHSKCCSDPEYTANSLAESWSEESP